MKGSTSLAILLPVLNCAGLNGKIDTAVHQVRYCGCLELSLEDRSVAARRPICFGKQVICAAKHIE
jgi:hypothetical protein